MKKIGIAIMVIGILFTVFTGFRFFTKKKVMDIGSVSISTSKPHNVNWSPYVGVALIVTGGIIFLAGKKG